MMTGKLAFQTSSTDPTNIPVSPTAGQRLPVDAALVVPPGTEIVADANATAAAPAYVEGTENPLSQDLTGNLRVVVLSGVVTTPTAAATAAAPVYGAGAQPFSQDLSGNLRVINSVSANPNNNPAVIVCTQYKVTAAAAAIGATAGLVNGVIVKAKTTNAGSVWVGSAGVTTTDDGTGNGYKLLPGEAASFGVTTLAAIFAIGTANDVLYIEGN